MAETAITARHTLESFFLLLVGIGPKLALVPFLSVTAPLDLPTVGRVRRQMLTTAATAAAILIVLGELLRQLLHFTVGSLSIAGGVILLVLSVSMVIGGPAAESFDVQGRDPMRLARVPLAVPYLFNPVGIVAVMTISAQADSWSVLLVEIGLLTLVLGIDVVVFRLVPRMRSRLDPDRMLVIEKVFGFLIAAIAVQLILEGLVQVGVLSHLIR